MLLIHLPDASENETVQVCISEANNGSTLAEIVMSSVDNTETVEDTACEAVNKSNEETLAKNSQSSSVKQLPDNHSPSSPSPKYCGESG